MAFGGLLEVIGGYWRLLVIIEGLSLTGVCLEVEYWRSLNRKYELACWCQDLGIRIEIGCTSKTNDLIIV